MNHFEKAIEDLSEAIDRDPEYSWALSRRGEAYRMLGNYEEAISDLERAIGLDPELSFAYASRGQAYREFGEYERALADFYKAIEPDPEYGWAIERRDELLKEMWEATAVQTVAAEEEPEPVGQRGPPQVAGREELPLVVVLDFRIENLPASDGKLIVDLLSSALIGTRRYRVLDRSQQESILKEIEFSYSDCVDERCQLEIGRLLAAERIVVGSLGRVGSRYILNVKLLEVESGEALASSYKVFPSLDDMVDGCPEVAQALSQ